MLQTLGALIPITLAGAFLPTWTSHVLLLLGTGRPVETSAAFVAGNATFRMLLGLGALFLFSGTAVETFVEGVPKPGPGGTALIGVALLALSWLVSRSRVDPDSDQLPGWMRSYEAIPPWLTFAWGFASVASPGIQYVYFLAGIAVISRAELTAAGEIAVLAVFVAGLQLMLVAPIGFYAARRDQADRTLARIKRWLASSGARVFAILLAVVGVAALIVAAFSAVARR